MGKAKDDTVDQEISIDLRDVEKASLKKMVGIKIGDSIEVDPKKWPKLHQLLNANPPIP